MVKRICDIVGAILGLVVSLPVLILAGILIRLEDRGPIFYRQTRVGRKGKTFLIHKLRTMKVGAEDELGQLLPYSIIQGPAYKIPNDPRVTRVGRFLRRWSIDELPQFINVLLGEMSLVGPRPEQVWVVEQYTDEQRKRLEVRPGLTGPMQINGRGLLGNDERILLELDYIENYSVFSDLIILFKTIPAVISGKGAF